MTVDHVSPEQRNAERRQQYHEADVVVVGAGVFGCAVAHALADQGRSVLLLERWMHEPDRIVGELLQPGGVAALRKLGLERCLEGIDAVPCYGYHILYHGDDVVIRYPVVDLKGNVRVDKAESARLSAAGSRTETESDKATGLGAQAQATGSAKGSKSTNLKQLKPTAAAPPASSDAAPTKQMPRREGRSFHHGRFIMQLRKACAAHRNITIIETEVTATIRGEHTDHVLGVESLTKNPETGKKEKDYFFGQLNIIADGYASKFRKEYVGKVPVVRSKFYALELIDCPFPPSGFGHVVIGKGYPVLLYQIGTHETRALIDVPENLPEASPRSGGVRGYIENVVVPNLPEPVRPSVLAALADGRIPKSMPNSWLPPTPQTRHRGIAVLGDAMNMRHPLTGGGMTVALNDVALLAELLHPARVPDLGDAAVVQRAMADFHWRRKSLTGIINVLAQALYSLFAAQDRHMVALQRGCFRYFQLGYTDEPVAMLGGLMYRPLVLFMHFFTVAFLAIWVHAADMCYGWGLLGALVLLPLMLLDAVLILWRACVVFLPVMWRELQ